MIYFKYNACLLQKWGGDHKVSKLLKKSFQVKEAFLSEWGEP